MTDYIGQQLGNYRLIQKLGSGGFADVYLAEHIYLGTPAAVKLLNANLASGDMQNFLNEAKTIARLVHPHIVHVLDFGVEQQRIPYLVMQYAPNGTLRQRHRGGTQVPLPLVVSYVRQVASALHYAHTQRLIHRDVKPENLLLGGNNEILLGDFGAALITRTSLMLTIQNIIGTASYMAPEQLQGKPTPASDQYALGIVVYEWLCGHYPFQGSLAELHNLQLYAHPPSLCAQIPTLHPAVEQVVMKALAKQPEQRFMTIEAFATALEQASQRVQAPPLFLPGDASARSHAPALATEVIQAPLPRPPVMPASLPATPLPETILASPPIPAKPLLSRRALLIGGLAVIGTCTVAWKLIEPRVIVEPPATPTPPGPTRAPTSIPTKNTPSYTYRDHQNQVFTAAWSPDDKYIASAGGDACPGACPRQGDTKVRVWEVQTGRTMYVYTNHSKLVRIVAWSPRDGTRIASASEDGTVQVWDATTGNNPLTYTGHTDVVMAVTWSPDGTHIASASTDHTVQVWDAVSGKSTFPSVRHSKGVTSVAWSPDGKFIASASTDGMVNVWEATTGALQQALPHKTQVGSLAWSPDSNYIATGAYNDDDSVKIWDINSGINKKVFPGRSGYPIYMVSWSPDGNYIAAGGDDGQVKIWRVTIGKQVTGEQILIYLGHTKPVMSVQWSHDGKEIASCGFDDTVQLWTIS